MNTILKRVVSLVLCFVLMASYLPAGAFALETGETVTPEITEVTETLAQTASETEELSASTETSEEESEQTDVSEKDEKEAEKAEKKDEKEAEKEAKKEEKESEKETETSTEPSSEATEPSSEATEPSSEATEPSSEATEPSSEPTEPVVIPVTGITLDQTELTVGVGELPMTLVATVLPEDATDKTVTWASSEPGVVSVDEKGELTFGYMGEAVITATAGEFSAGCTITVGEGDWDTFESDSIVVIAGSDYQLSNSGSIMTNIMNHIEDDYDSVYGVLMGGDYDAGSVNTKASHIEAVDNTISGVFPEIDVDNRVYIQGNHENFAGLKPSSSNLMTTEHVRDTEYYGVYAINHDDFPWTTSTNPAPSESLVKGTADDLGDYLEAKIAAGYSKPIFVMSHLPLHATTRGDNRYAKLIFDELEAAGEAGLNIIFLVGHNHSGGYDQYLGNGSFYLPEGSSLTVVEGTTGKYTDSSISFTYMNYGYLGRITGSACTHQTMTAFEITDDQVTVKRYATDGAHQLKAAGVAVSGYNTDTRVIGTDGATITLTTPTVEEKVEQTHNNVTVVAPGLTNLTVEKKFGTGSDAGYDKETYAAFASYDITPVGYEQGKTATVTITLDEADGFDPSRKVIVLDGDTVLTTTTIVNGTVTFTATHFSVYSVAQAAESALEWKEIPGGIVYQLDTDGLTADTKYLIVNTGADGSGVALRNEGGSEGTTAVTISGGAIILEADTDVAWTPNSATSGHFKNQSEYLRLNSSSYDLVTGSSTTLTISNQNNGAYRISATVSSGGWWGSETTYYLAYNSEWESTTTASNVYLYECKGSGNGGYAAMTGTTVYSVVTNTTDAAALEARIRSGLTVYTASVANGTDAATTTDYTLSGTCDPTKAGTYTYTVAYGGVELGTVTVYVNDVTINGISVSPSSGVVTVGASEAALVGATITVDVADGEDFTVPVTVGMLEGDVDTSVVGTYTGLTVTYSGKTYENFTLTVKERVVNNYPSYPDEGAVKVDKKAHGIDFQKTGVAQVELTTSGVPMNQGVDVVIMLDTSSSMTRSITVNGESVKRIDLLRPAVNELIEQLQTKRPDGSEPDIDIVIASFNGNTINTDSNYISDGSSKPQISGTGTDACGVLTGQKTVKSGWVDIMSLPTEWGSSESNLPTGSGTNYDYGLELVYELLEQKQTDNGENARKQFVLFMSDGAPSQYNGVWANDGVAEFAEWLLGNYDETDENTANDIPDTVSDTNKTFYTGYRAGKGQLHRAAEAIKGAPTDTFAYVTYDSNGNGSLKPVNGLGATVYSIGLLLQDVENVYGGSSPRTAEDQQTVLNTIASREDLAISITTVDGLGETFTRFGNDVLYAAENAVFEDQLGASFNIQMANTTTRLVDGKEFTLDPAPTMEVREYTIWTRAELEDDNGNLSEANAKKVGTRKTNADGSYIYKPLEVVSFNAAGTEAYTGGDTTKNIMVDGVICANTFWFNTTAASVMIDVDGDTANGNEFELKPETFLWKVGTIKSTELALSYYVYLDDSLEGDASAGSYETNTYAILEYDNYLGNPCHKDTTSPQMAWLSANVSYAYYLVNEDGQPVDENGTVIPFANRKIIVNPTKHSEIKLNTITDVDNLTVASTGVLDDSNYTLYDYDAEYILSVNSDATGGWEIEVGDGKALTTYVTGFSDTESFTNATSSTSEKDNYDYTHTTVWFAVVWEPDALDDTVVIDYGLPVDVHVMTNDFFGDFGELIGVAKDEVTNIDNDVKTNEIPASSEPVTGTYGTAQVKKPETGANESNSVIRYTLGSMEMTEPDVFTYSVEYTNTKLHANNGFYYGKLTVIPATTIYFEDTFLDLKSYSREDSSAEYTEANLWKQVTENTATQDEDRPGNINFAFDTIIDANNVYGYDSAYKTMSTHSLGNAAQVHVDANSYATAEFSFYGTGFDVISMTSNTTGTLLVRVYDKDGNRVRNTVVDTFYGMNADGSLSDNTPEAIYQVPVIKIFGLDYGMYDVTITATYGAVSDHTSAGSYDLYLDAIRIYDPTGNENEIANNAYREDGEAYPVYEELRDNIIEASKYQVTENEDGTVTVSGTDLSGAIFIDCNSENTSIADYVSYGPNNELYLDNGQAIAFTVAVTETMADVQLGIKVANGDTVTYKINGDSYTVNSTTDMYYSIWDYVKGGNVVTIENVSGGILSLTNIKTTFNAATSTNGLLRMTAEDAGTALMMLRRAPVVEDEIPETTVPDESVPETTVPEETEPEATEPETTEPEATEPEETQPDKDAEKLEKELKKAMEKAAKELEKAMKKAAKALSQLFKNWF